MENDGAIGMTEPKENHQPQETLDEEELHRLSLRPPDIEQDVKEMEKRKRVEMIMNSQVFREELERIIESQLSEGYVPANLAALQQVTQLLLPRGSSSVGRRGGGMGTAIPINDIRGVEGLRYAKGEKLLRCKLAAVCRILDMYGWAESMANYITVRVSQDQEHFLVHPLGLQLCEVTASSLLKVDMQGNVIEAGTTTLGYNRPAFALHSVLHAARPDLKCVLHLHHTPCIAISATKCGLLPITQEAALLGEISYHESHGLPVDRQEREELARSLGPRNKVLIIRNRGFYICGESVEEALFLAQNVAGACETQLRLMPLGVDNIQLLSAESRDTLRDQVLGSGKAIPLDDGGGDEDKEQAETKEPQRKWKVWDLEFEALMRMLDNAGYRTGYIYRQPLVRTDQPKAKTDVEVPPAASSYSQYFDENKWLSPLKKLMEGRKMQDKMRWVHSPNVYQKVEVLETGTTEPKKITKWVQEGSPSHSTTVKIADAHQFVPKSADPKEFKRKQKELKENRMKAMITAGPQSQLLEGVTWEEVRKMQDAKPSGTEDQVVLVGAASKGIIQREFQHNAMVYKTAYSRNPFDNVSDQELEEYRKIVEKKQRGEPVEEEIPDEIKALLVEPVADESATTTTEPKDKEPRSPTSPVSEEEAVTPEPFQRSFSARMVTSTPKAPTTDQDNYFTRRFRSERKYKKGETVVNGEEKRGSAGDVSATSRSSKESSPIKDLSEGSPKKEKKKKKGITSFLKKKKHSRKEKEDKEKEA